MASSSSSSSAAAPLRKRTPNSPSSNGHPPSVPANGSARPGPSDEPAAEGQLEGKRILLGGKRGDGTDGWWEKYEVPRKTLHSSIGILTLVLNYLDPPSLAPLITVLSVTLALVVAGDVLRFNWPAFARVYESKLGILMRSEERHKPNGVIWYLVGVIFVLSIYPRDVAVLSILILSWADTAASTLGRLFSRTPYNLPLPRTLFGLPIAPSKSVVGFLAAWITGTAVAVGYYGGGPGGGESRGGKVDWRVLEWRRGVAITGTMVGFVAAVTEALDVGTRLDDNLTLPIVSGALVWAWLSISSRFL